MMLPAGRTLIRRAGGLYALERALQRRGFGLVAGADEAGRGACAGPLVVGAAILPEGRRGLVPLLADSKLLTPAVREQVYQDVLERAVATTAVVIPAAEVDRRGLQVSNIAGMRRALAALPVRPDYVLTDGFGVDGLGVPGLAVWKGDQVAACVAAASVVAKVTRDRIMIDLDRQFPGYGFAEHKGYVTPEHAAALRRHGPCTQHRFSYVNVAAACLIADAESPIFWDEEEDQAAGLSIDEELDLPDAPGRSGRIRLRSTVGVAEGAGSWGPAGVGENGHVKGGTA